ncbi:MAG: septation protein SpoVG family protein [Candidatus Babeliales bacterium]|jgi:stage V sporulation protein G
MLHKVTEVNIVPIKPNNGLVGFASIVFDDSFYLGSIGIFTRPQGGYRLTYPTRKALRGGFNIFHPINRLVAEQIEHAVISKYKEIVSTEEAVKLHVGYHCSDLG